MAPIGIAVIGSGLFIQESHIPAIYASPDLISLKAIYSRSLASATALHARLPLGSTSVSLYADDAAPDQTYAALLSRPDITAVIIALPILAQPEYIKSALSAGKHVLSEKPIAGDLSTAKALIEWYGTHVDTSRVFWGVAENFRFLERFAYGARQVSGLGRVLGFRLRMHALVKPGSKYYETQWRKKPEYQGGFLLDGGPHFVAGMRRLLGGAGVVFESVSAHTAQLQEHLPPIDTVNAAVKLANGASGTVGISFGTTFTGVEYMVACERGTVDVQFDHTVVKKGEEESVERFPDDKNGVKQEVRAWAESITAGKPHPLQSPAEGLADLEMIEAMIKSGESNGAPVKLTMQ